MEKKPLLESNIIVAAIATTATQIIIPAIAPSVTPEEPFLKYLLYSDNVLLSVIGILVESGLPELSGLIVLTVLSLIGNEVFNDSSLIAQPN